MSTGPAPPTGPWRLSPALFLLTWLLLAAPAAAVVRIAAHYPLTGTGSSLDAFDGLLFWQDWVNTKFGGINVSGTLEPIALTLRDDRGLDSESKRLFQEFVDDGYKFVIGGRTQSAQLSKQFFEPHKVRLPWRIPFFPTRRAPCAREETKDIPQHARVQRTVLYHRDHEASGWCPLPEYIPTISLVQALH